MSASTLIPLRDVWAMLDHCLPGYTVRTTNHHHRITGPDGRCYPSLPLGPHGRRSDNTDIKAGNIRNMVRFFQIEPCAREQLPAAFGLAH